VALSLVNKSKIKDAKAKFIIDNNRMMLFFNCTLLNAVIINFKKQNNSFVNNNIHFVSGLLEFNFNVFLNVHTYLYKHVTCTCIAND
jgi:hypothetical protein